MILLRPQRSGPRPADPPAMNHRARSWVLVGLLLAGCRGGGTPSGMDSGGRHPESPVVVAVAFANALNSAEPSAALEWVRPESRALIVRHPEVLARMQSRVAELGDPAALELAVRREHAALFDPAKPSVPPLLLRLDEGGWEVDVVEIEKSYAPLPELQPRMLNTRNPYRRLVTPFERQAFSDFGEVDLYAEPFEEAIARLGRAEDFESKTRLAEILLRNGWLVDEALDVFEEVARNQPEDFAPTRRFAEVAMVVGSPERAVALVERFGPESYLLRSQIYSRTGRSELVEKYIHLHIQQLQSQNATPH